MLLPRGEQANLAPRWLDLRHWRPQKLAAPTPKNRLKHANQLHREIVERVAVWTIWGTGGPLERQVHFCDWRQVIQAELGA